VDEDLLCSVQHLEAVARLMWQRTHDRSASDCNCRLYGACAMSLLGSYRCFGSQVTPEDFRHNLQVGKAESRAALAKLHPQQHTGD